MATCRRAGARQKGDNRKNTEIKEEPPPKAKNQEREMKMS